MPDVLEQKVNEQVSPHVQEPSEQRILHPLIPILNRITHKTFFDPDENITVIEEGFGLDGLRIQGLEFHVVHAGEIPIETYWHMTFDLSSFLKDILRLPGQNKYLIFT